MSQSVQPNVIESSTKYYYLRDHNVNGSEWERLDELHRGFDEYMKGELTFAPLDKPLKILDIGAGSGAWAIQAAHKYTEAEVIASDISPLPARPLPPNLKYQHCDILEPLPFEPDTFDVVHMRLLLYHLPKLQIPSVIERITRIMKPNGWLIIEDFGRHTGHSTSRGPAQEIIELVYQAMLRNKGLESRIGEHLGHILHSTDNFREINIKKVELILSADNAIPGVSIEERGLSNAIRSTIVKVVAAMQIGEDLRSVGITPDLQKVWATERDDPEFKTFYDVWFTWSRKR